MRKTGIDNIVTRKFPKKPPFGWGESGLFSGANEKTVPGYYSIAKTQAEADGSTHVTVRLKYQDPNLAKYSWNVIASLKKENGHFVLDDVAYYDEDGKQEGTMQEMLTAGCTGDRWTGRY